jgi:hypothetical protein
MLIGDLIVEDWLIDRACSTYNINKKSIVVEEEKIKRLNDDITREFFETRKIPLIAIDQDGTVYQYIKLNVLKGRKVPLTLKIYFFKSNKKGE